MNILIKQSRIALIYFLLIACLGVFLRLIMVVNISANYKYLVHTHSHIALLGWVYTALMILIYKMYLSKTKVEKKYSRLFWWTQMTVIGMLISFPFTGYALFSIVFSTLFLIMSYLFTWLVFKQVPKAQKERQSYKFIRVALWYMIISSIGPWALGIIMNTLGSGSNLYRNAIYFYLHFQYNGWFIIALLGSFIYVVEQCNCKIDTRLFRYFFWFFNLGVIATFFISLLWMGQNSWIHGISILGAIFQLIGFGILIKMIFPIWNSMKEKSTGLLIFMIRLVSFLLVAKLILQLLGAFPYFSKIISSNIDFVIGYIHWIFLGVVSLSLLAFLQYFKLIKISKTTILIYIVGFALMEGLLFYKGIVVWQKLYLMNNYFWYLVIVSCILLIGIMMIFMEQFSKNFNQD